MALRKIGVGMVIIYYIFNMTLIGSAICLLFVVMEQITKRFFTAAWHYNILKCILLFFVVPFGKLGELFLQSRLMKPHMLNLVNVGRKVVPYYLNALGNNMFEHIEIYQYILTVWIVGMGVILIRQLVCYIRFRYIVRSNRITADWKLYAVTEQCKNELGIRKHIKLYVNEYINTPMLTGLFRPVILIPGNDFNTANAKCILSHELTHFKQKDVIIKFFTVMIRTIHWFNPVVYLLSSEMNKWCEYACDERNAVNMTHEMKKQYGMAILEAAVDMPVYSTDFGASLLLPKQDLKKRLMYMLNVKKMKKKVLVISVLFSIAFIGTGITFAFASESLSIGSWQKYDENFKKNDFLGNNIEDISASDIRVIE